MTRSSPGVHRVVAILNFFADHPGQAFTLTDLVRALKLSRATCHALLVGLVECGYLYRASDKSYILGPAPMALDFWPGAVTMMLYATLTATLVTNSGRSAWFVGVLLLMVYLIFAMTLYLLPPAAR